MITRFAIKNHILTLSILVLLIVMGISAFEEMPRDDMPQFLIRVVNIVTSNPGMSPERMENLITDKIEKVVQEVVEIDYIKSESRTGISIINVAIKESEFDLQPIYDRLRRKVDDVQDQLPDGSKVTFKDELGDVFGIILGLTVDGFSFSEMKDIADEIRDDLIRLSNVAKVEISGIQDEMVYVEFDASRLAASGVTQKKLQDIISAANIVVPGGNIIVTGRNIIIEPSGSFENLDDLRNIVLSKSGNSIVRLRDVSTIRQAYVEPRKNIVSINGEPGLAIAVNLREGGNIISLGHDLDTKIKEYLEIYPHGVEISRLASQDYVVDKSVNDFLNNLIQSVIVVLLVMLLFLGLRTGLVVASLIPVTMVTALLLMSLFDVGLNKVTLASLIIALGMLVDNAIVMSESVLVKMEKGQRAYDAAIKASQELWIPLLTSSLTTSAAFMAFYLAESVMGEIMGNIFIVLTFALLSSWMLSITMISLLCVYVLKLKDSSERKKSIFDTLSFYYKKVLVKSLRYPKGTIALILFVFVASIFSMRFIPNVFMAKSDRALVSVNIELPLGTTIDTTQEMVADIETMIQDELLVSVSEKGMKTQGVLSWSSYIGAGAPKYDLGYTAPESSPHAAHILINTSSDAANDPVIEKVDDYIFNNYPDSTYKVSRLVSGGGSANPIEVRLSGKDIDTLYKKMVEIKALLRQIPGSKGISDDWGMRSKKLVVDIGAQKAQLAGVTHNDIATSLQTVLGGKQSGTLRQGDKVIPIIMQDERSTNLSIEELESLDIYAQQSGAKVPLKQVADINVVWQTSKIIRRDLEKTITITADVKKGFTATDIIKALKPELKKNSSQWEAGYGYELGGDAEGASSAMGAVVEKLPLSVFIIILLLIAQFNSIRKPLIIIATIPLGLIGVVIGLLVTGSYFGFMAFLGIISLAGIVINNGIVLLDRIAIEQEENGRCPYNAIVEAALQRFRPIVLTTATTSLGLIPLWLGGGLMWEPMAISIIFGLMFATVLTLLFVPVMYRVLFRVSLNEL